VTAYNENLSIYYNMAAQSEQEVQNELRLLAVSLYLVAFVYGLSILEFHFMGKD